MINLAESGLPLFWDRDNLRLVIGPGMDEVVPAVRRREELKDLLYGAGNSGPPLKDAFHSILYYMYRNLHLRENTNLFKEKRLRYDLTILIPGHIGLEYVKTAGHYHPLKFGTFCTYPEVYEVLHGKAHYLLQKPKMLSQPEKGLEQILVVAAEAGDKVLIPSGFGHITINPGTDFLIMSNLVAANFASVYEPLQKMKGAGYFELFPAAGQGRPLFVPNPCYSFLPPLCICSPLELPALSLCQDVPLYRAFIENPAHFAFLTDPEDFQEEFRTYLLALATAK